MSWLAAVFGGGAAGLVDSVGDAGDRLFTSDEERLKWQAVRAQMATDLEKTWAAHRSIFVAGARPFIMWVCGFGLAYQVARPVLSVGLTAWLGSAELPPLDETSLEIIAWTALGYGTLRGVDKWRG